MRASQLVAPRGDPVGVARVFVTHRGRFALRIFLPRPGRINTRM